jgi:autotransporter-associated beta strand protein
MPRVSRGQPAGEHQNTFKSTKVKRRPRSGKLLAAVVAPAAVLALGANRAATAATLTWDASGAADGIINFPTDGSGSWNTSINSNWNPGGISTDQMWVDGSSAVIGAASGAAGTITIDSGSVTANSVQFNAPGSGSYTIAGSGGSSLIMGGATPTISVVAGTSPTINVPLAGSAGVALGGIGTLNLGVSNSISGPIAINSGTLSVGASSDLGSTSNIVSIGTTYGGSGTIQTATGSLVLAPTTTTIGGLLCQSMSTTANTITINNGSTLNVTSTGSTPVSGLNAVFASGINISSNAGFSAANTLTTALNMSGGGSLAVDGTSSHSSFYVAMSDVSNVGNNPTFNIMSNLNMSGLANFSFTTTNDPTPTGNPPALGAGEFALGVGISTNGTTTLATTLNAIKAGTVHISDSQPTPGSPNPLVAGNAGSSTYLLQLGPGTNTLNTSALIMGRGRASGIINWASTASGTVTIAGYTGGASTTDITIGVASGGTPSSIPTNPNSFQLNLAGHNATVQAGTVLLGQLTAGASAGKATTTTGGTIVFDTGTFTAANLIMGVTASDNTVSLDGVAGTFNLGSGASSTGVLNVTNSFIIGQDTGGLSAGAKSTFTIRGGTANISCNIIDKSTAGTSGTTIGMSGGLLNMNGFAIGTIVGGSGGTRPITTVNLPTLGNVAALANLGGDGINGGGLVLSPSTAAGSVVLTGTLALEGTSTYTGATTINSGTLQVGLPTDTVAPTGALEANVTNNSTLAYGSSQSMTLSNTIVGTGGVVQNGTGTTTVTGANTYSGANVFAAGALAVNTLASSGVSGPLGVPTNAASNLMFEGGTLKYSGAGETTDRVFTITPTGGGIDASGTGAVNFTSGLSVVTADAVARNTPSESTGSTKLTLPSVYDLVNGMTVSGPNIQPGTTILAVNPAASSITLSLPPTATVTTPQTITFGGAIGRTLTLTGTNTGTNTFADPVGDSPAGGQLSLAKAGTGNWILTSAANTYTGNTNVSAGTLTLAAGASIATSPNINVSNGGTFNVNGMLSATANVTANGAVNFAGNPATTPFTRTLGSLSVGSSGAVTVTMSAIDFTPATLEPTSLSIALGGTVDLKDNILVAPGASTDALNFIIGASTGHVVTTDAPLALGYGDAGGGNFKIRATLLGDSDLDGRVNVADLANLAGNFGVTSGMLWINGDFDYNGNVNVADLADLAGNFGNALAGGTGSGAATPAASSAAAGGGAAVPEPASAGMLGIALLGLMSRRQRNRPSARIGG